MECEARRNGNNGGNIIIVATNAINVIVTAVENKKFIDKSIVKIYHIMYNKEKIQKNNDYKKYKYIY